MLDETRFFPNWYITTRIIYNKGLKRHLELIDLVIITRSQTLL